MRVTFTMSSNKRFFHEVTTERKPWTHENFGGGSDSDDFNFIIFGDRAGACVQSITEAAFRKINLLNPDFVMSVGDFIRGLSNEGVSREFLTRQWAAFEKERDKCEPPFFHVTGNHDIPAPDPAFPGGHELMTEMWEERFGVTYYAFIFKDVLFICLHTMDEVCDIGEKQLEWALETLKKHHNVRWTFVFMHSPRTWVRGKNFARFTDAINDRNYTVFAGDMHNYQRYRRHGRNYYMVGVTGAQCKFAGVPLRGVPFGEFQQLVWVSFKNGEPRVSVLELDGIHEDDVVTTAEMTYLTGDYFHGDEQISAEEAAELEAKGLKIYRETYKFPF